MDRPSDTLSRNVSEYYAATPPTKNTPFYSVCGCGLYTDCFNYRTFHTHKLTSGFVGDGGYDEVYVPNGERMQVLFQDGSKVHLNSGSRIRYPKKFGLSERKVYLEGEAYFEVEHDGNAPFYREHEVHGFARTWDEF